MDTPEHDTHTARAALLGALVMYAREEICNSSL